jgi:hypothetical protein
MPSSASPTTVMPITDPPAKATLRAASMPCVARMAVRELAAVATRMPKKPAAAEQSAPSTKDRACRRSAPLFASARNAAAQQYEGHEYGVLPA